MWTSYGAIPQPATYPLNDSLSLGLPAETIHKEDDHLLTTYLGPQVLPEGGPGGICMSVTRLQKIQGQPSPDHSSLFFEDLHLSSFKS